MKQRSIPGKILLGLVFVLAIVSCSVYLNPAFKKMYSSVNEVLYADTVKHLYLKAHCRNGDVYVFEHPWSLTADSSHISGTGLHFNARRERVGIYAMSVPLDSIVLYETNEKVKSVDGKLSLSLGLLTAANLVGIIYCAINPKACFGSCPTFYLPGDEGIKSVRAEGFSASVLPSLEAADLDELNNSPISQRRVTVIMKNEAPETHVVNYVHLLAVSRTGDEKIYHDMKSRFYSCKNVQSPVYAFTAEKDVTQLLSSFDREEYFSRTDSFDLAKKEEIVLHYKITDGNASRGLVLTFRNSLVTTFIFYSAIGFMGKQAGDYMARIESDQALQEKIKNLQGQFGGIEAFAWNETQQKWISVGRVYETGPIARNTMMIPLPPITLFGSDLKIKLVMAKGYWRLDCALLTEIERERQAVQLMPDNVTKNYEKSDDDLKALTSDDKMYACTIAGDQMQISYMLPDTNDYALFLESKGYYFEWMRPTWWKESNPVMIRNMLAGDEKTWRNLAIEYKLHEEESEATFWNSTVN